MSKFYSLEDVRGDEFYQLPKDLVKNNKYKTLSANAKIAYAILKDRHQVSLKNHWVDEVGVYFLLSDGELAEILDTSIRSASRYKNDLQSFGLIHMERQGLNKRNKIYLLKPDTDILEKKQPEPLILADRTKLSSPDKTILSSQDRTVLSSQDRTILSTYSNNNLSNNDFSNNKKEEEEESFQQISDLKDLFKNCIGTVNSVVENKLKDWLLILPFEVIKGEIENGALYNAKSWFYIEKALQEDLEKNIRTVADLNNKINSYKASKAAKKPRSNKKSTRTEILPNWYEKDLMESAFKHSEEKKVVNAEELEARQKSLEEKLKKFKK
jgi:DNA replication protein DnaD